MSSAARVATSLLLIAVWCALWGDFSVANVLSGAVVSVVVVVLAAARGPRRGVRIAPLLRFGVLVAVDLFRSTVAVAWEVVTPHDRIDEAIIAVEVPRSARSHLLMLSGAVTLTPGTAVVDVDAEAGILYLHVLHAEEREPSIEHVKALAELACAALPVEERPPPEEAPS